MKADRPSHVMLQLAFFFALFSIVLSQNVRSRCLHKECELSSGLSVQELNRTINSLLINDEYDFRDNVLRFVTWNLDLSKDQRLSENWSARRKIICEYIKQLQPSILGLQQVLHYQLTDIETCLPTYTFLHGKPTVVNGEELFNPIIYKNWRRLRITESGSFSLSVTPNIQNSKLTGSSRPATCTWIRMQFAERKSRYAKSYVPRSIKRESLRDLILRLLKKYTNQSLNKEKRSSLKRPRTVYRWVEVYVAVTKLDGLNELATVKQAHILTKHLRNKIMDRRRYPIVVMGDYGFEDNSPVYSVFDKINWLKNTMVTSRGKYPALSLVRSDENDKEGLVDNIWQNKFKSVLSGTMMDTESTQGKIADHSPVLAALYPAM